MSLRLNKEGYYIVDSTDKLKEWHRMTDMSHIERLALMGEKKKPKVVTKKKSTKKQTTKKEDKPELTDFQKWFK